MKEILSGVKNIIFDLGEVIIDLDFSATEKAFAALLQKDAKAVFTYAKQTEVFDLLETGKITPEEFRSHLRHSVDFDISTKQIDAAWNAMLLTLPAKKIELVQSLQQNYQTFVLSNTNKIHIDYVEKVLLPEHNISSLDAIFDFVYYSHIIGERKPNPEAFTFILQKHKLLPQETLFIDDKLENVETAKRLGLKTWHLTNREDLYELA